MIAMLAAALSVAGPALPPRPIRTMIRDVRAIAARTGQAVWPGFDRAPIVIDLIGGDREYLFCRPRAPGFAPIGRDPVTGCPVLTRARVFEVDQAASLDIAPGVDAVAIGTPSALEMDAANWRFTLLHEAFHQYQASLPGYAAAVRSVREAIGGGRADWALGYPFPYADPRVAQAFATMTREARAFLLATTREGRRAATDRYVAAREAAAAVVGTEAWRYYEFQVGQEGVARWTEIVLGERTARRDPAMAAIAGDRRGGLATSLGAIDGQGLAMWKRSAFYVFGAIEAEMLEQDGPGWRADYVRAPFATGRRLAAMTSPRR